MTALPAVAYLTAYRGDTWAQTFRFLRGGTPVDLTAATVEAEARPRTGAPIPLVVTVDDATDGRIILSLPGTSLPADTYQYDIEVLEGSTVTTFVRGKLNVVRDVTNELG